MKTVKRVGSIFFLLVFLFGTTGLTVLRHTCISSKQNNVTVFPEFFKSSDDGCCENETTGYASACCSCHETAGTHPQVDSSPCCKSDLSFFKLEILTKTVDKLKLDVLNAFLHFRSNPLVSIPLFEQPVFEYAHYQFHSPPLFGRTLVYFLHQIKIPDHPSLI